MKNISIEKALVWAYRDQMVHAALPQGTPVEISQGYSPGLSEGRFLADKVDAGVVAPFVAAPDAYAIHAAVMRLKPVTVQRSADEMEMLFARKLMRNEYDGMDRQAGGDAARPAPTVTLKPSSLVFEHALAANQPDRAEEPAMKFERGQRVYMDAAGRVVSSHHRFGFMMLVAVGDDPLEVIASRRKYAVWHQALCDLRQGLKSSLKHHQLTAEMPMMPAGS